MTFDFRQVLPTIRRTQAIGLASVLGCVALLLIPLVFPLDGQSHGDWPQFFGRFHPLIVHLPIGLILLVPVLEIAGRLRPALREAAGLVLWLSVPVCVGSTILGFLLAYGSGDTGHRVTLHMWGGIALTIAVLLCAEMRAGWVSGGLGWGYPSFLGGVLCLLLWSTHQGGLLTHGDRYLTEHVPAGLKQWPSFQGTETTVAPTSFYAMQIHPIFNAKCVSCHGPSKVKGKLRLDSYDRLMRGGEDGAVIIPSDSGRSILFHRITLPANDKKFMPTDGKPPLTPREVAMIKAWIDDGASPSAVAVKGFASQAAEPAVTPLGDYSGTMAEIQRTAVAAGASVVPVSGNPADGLILNMVDAPDKFGDAQLATFQKFAPYIVDLELGRTAVTDACFDIVAKFQHLRALHLEGTTVTGNGLVKLNHLSQLAYINLSGTKVTREMVAPLNAMSQPRHIDLYNTPANSASQVAVVPAPEDPTKVSKAP